MASTLPTTFSSPKQLIVALSLLSLLLAPCFCSRPNRMLDNNNDPSYATDWSCATATWYGNPYGFGTDGGACGYQGAVGTPPFSSMITSVGPSLYKDGRGCGACYQIRCASNSLCSGRYVTVVVTDSCPGCTEDAVRFDLSGTAFGALARSFSADQLRNLGRMPVQYRRVPCRYHNINLTFRIDSGSNPYYLAVLVKYQAGDGDISSLDVGDSSGNWHCMQPSWGSVWKYNSDTSMPGPFSFKITTGSGKTLVANNVVPCGWQPGNTYVSSVNF